MDWQKGDALEPDTFAHLFSQVGGVVHTLGTLIEDGKYKQALKEGNIVGLVGSFFRAVTGDHGNPLERNADRDRKGSYEVINRDTGSLFPVLAFFQLLSIAALRVCEAFVSSSASEDVKTNNIPRPFVYLSAEDIFRPVIPARYIETKREAEQGIESIMLSKPDYRGVYMRPSTCFLSGYTVNMCLYPPRLGVPRTPPTTDNTCCCPARFIGNITL